MALTITEQVMRSPDTAHTAKRAVNGWWHVSWLGDRALTREQAITGMTIAEEVGRIPADADPEAYSDTFWTLIDPLAAELDLSGPNAVARVSENPGLW